MTSKLELSANQRHVLGALDITLWQLRQDEVVSEPAPVVAPRSEREPIPDALSGLAGASDSAVSSDREPASHSTPLVMPEVDQLDWVQLRRQVASCQACELSQQRTQAVFGAGDESADWLIVGEAPGEEEDLRGEPFVGRAGQLLDNMLLATGLTRQQVYVANIVKCRPPRNRDPHINERRACGGYLRRQITLLQPKVIVVVGRVAAHAILETEEAVGALRGRQLTYAETEIPLVVTYHPAYLLRSPAEKSKVWDDLCFARERYNQSLIRG